MKNYYSISFISMSIGWIGLIVTHVIWSVINYNDASGGDTGVIIFWSGLFSLLFYLLFVILPKKFISNQIEQRSFLEFTIGSAFYSLIGFIILIGWLFLKSNFYGVFLDAFIAGLISGGAFWWIWNKKEESFKSIPSKIFGYFIPILFLVIYLKVFPNLFPKFAYNYVPQSIQNELEIQTLSKVKIGNSIEDIKNQLPGFIGHEECRGIKAGQNVKYEFRLQWNCCKVVDIEVGERGMIDRMIEGEIVNKPCE